MRNTKESLAGCIVPLNPNKKMKLNMFAEQDKREPILDIIAFTLYGKQEAILDELGYEDEDGYPATSYETDDLSFAYVDYTGKVPSYYVKRNRRGFLADPINTMGDDPSLAASLDEKLYNYTKVSKDCFLCYLQFLATKNPAKLNAAQLLYQN